jgi:membrane protease YdiL (CAAX protease family)
MVFPITQGLVELALYFLYVMPRLDPRPFPNLRPLLLPGLMLGLQHFAVPLLFNPSFILWRALMYIPFAFAVGLILHWRPRLLPYLAIIHVLMDMSFAAMFLMPAS